LPLQVTLQPRDPAALAAAVQAVSDPTSPQYRHFLTPGEFALEYGPTAATISQVTDALEAKGLTVGNVSATGLSLPVSADVAQAETAFGTPISEYKLSSGHTGYYNTSAPSVAATVAPQIQGVLGLDTLSPPVPVDSIPTPTQVPAGMASAGTSPNLAPGQPSPTSGSCSNSIGTVKTDYKAWDADDLAQAYSFGPLYNSGDYGAGSTVALVELAGAGFSQGDVSTFANCYGISLAANQVTSVPVDGGGATGADTVEAELDIDTVLSLAPKADIDVYEGGSSDSLYDVFNSIINADSANVISASWTNGCEAYVGQALQDSENTLFESAAIDGQSIFVASGDEGAQGCNVNGEISASTGSDPVAQTVDPTSGTLYVVNKTSKTVSVDSEGSQSNPSDFSTEGSVTTGTTPDAAALYYPTTTSKPPSELYVANKGGNSLTEVATATCNATNTSGCGTTSTVTGAHISGPSALAVVGSTLYVANSNTTLAVYNATTNTWVASVTLLSATTPTALAVDSASDTVYITDGVNHRVEYFSGTTCNDTTTTGCSAAPASVSVGTDPVAMAVDSSAGDLYVANAGTGGGISAVSLSSHAVTATVSTAQPQLVDPPTPQTGLAESLAMAPNGTSLLADISGYSFPGDVLATINTTTQAISATVGLDIGADSTGQLVTDPTRGYAWLTDGTKGGDVVQNLNPAVSDPASQPEVTAVGGTSLTALGPDPTESVWNDQLNYAEGAGGGGISQTFDMPAYQQSLGTVSGSSATPCGNSDGDCREIPDVSADADPSTGYIIYDSVNGDDWTAVGGTSGAAPLWAAVLADITSSTADTTGFGNLNPTLYSLAQASPGTYFNDVTSGNNDYNGTNGGQFAALPGYDMATGLGTPITSALATGIALTIVYVTVSGTQTYGSSSPSFTEINDAPEGISVSGSLTCGTVGASTAISPTLSPGPYTVLATSCSGAALIGTNASGYSIAYLSANNGFTVTPAPLTITASSGSMVYGGTPPTITPGYSGFVNGNSATSLTTQPTCSTTATSASAAGSSQFSLCSGAVDPNYTFTYVAGSVTVDQAPLGISASATSTNFGTVPNVTPSFSGLVNGDTSASLTTPPTCSSTVTANTAPNTYIGANSCAGAVDANYSISYTSATATVSQASLIITALGTSTPYGTVPTVTPTYAGFVDGNTSASLTTQPTCSTTVSASSTPNTYAAANTCTGAADSNYLITYQSATATVTQAALTVTASNGTMNYGATPPSITASYSGFVNGQNALSLTTQPTCSTTAKSSSPAGSAQTSSCSGAVDSNYSFAYSPGTMVVNKAALTITATTSTSNYGSVPTITASYSGFVNGDTSTSLSTKPTCSSTVTVNSAPNTYVGANTCVGAADSNYSISYTASTATVNAVPLSVTASVTSSDYGSIPTVTPAYSGFVNGQSSSSLTTQPTCSSTVTDNAVPNTYPGANSCTGAVDLNYSISYTSSKATVTPAPLTITASSGAMTYGGIPPTITPDYHGFVNDQSASNLSTVPTCSTTATSSSPAGSAQTSSCSGAVDANYTIGYSQGTVTVDAGSVTITVSGGQGFGASSPSFSQTNDAPTGIGVNGTVTCGAVTSGSAITPSLPVGSYTLAAGSCSGISLIGTNAADYVATYAGAPNGFVVASPGHGYWLVGSDGGIFSFGSAQFYGSTGNIKLNKPVVGITPTANLQGYWLVASDGGIFSFGSAQFYGSAANIHLNAPVVGMVPSYDDNGYFMVASDGGVFAFGDAAFEGSCPGIGGCSGPAVSVMPDATGRGYWLVTQTGHIYTFGDAAYLGAPGPQSSSVTSAVRTPDGGGYWILLGNGTVYAYGDAVNYGGPGAAVNALDPSSAIFTTSDGGGYWVATALGAVYTYGDAPNDGSMAGTHLNGSIIAATGF
jgi:hypothetical protein